jgi:hypothetical protein
MYYSCCQLLGRPYCAEPPRLESSKFIEPLSNYSGNFSTTPLDAFECAVSFNDYKFIWSVVRKGYKVRECDRLNLIQAATLRSFDAELSSVHFNAEEAEVVIDEILESPGHPHPDPFLSSANIIDDSPDAAMFPPR